MINIRMTSRGRPLVYTDHATIDDVLIDVGNGLATLPMSTGVPILPNQSAHITARLRTACNLKRLMISNAGTAGGASDWVVNDVKVDGVSQFLKPGSLSGRLFATSTDPDALDVLKTLVRFTPVLPEMAVDLIVTYIGPNPRGCPFFAALIGERAATAVSPASAPVLGVNPSDVAACRDMLHNLPTVAAHDVRHGDAVWAATKGLNADNGPILVDTAQLVRDHTPWMWSDVGPIARSGQRYWRLKHPSLTNWLVVPLDATPPQATVIAPPYDAKVVAKAEINIQRRECGESFQPEPMSPHECEEWSKALRSKIAASKERERMRVVVQGEWEPWE